MTMTQYLKRSQKISLKIFIFFIIFKVNRISGSPLETSALFRPQFSFPSKNYSYDELNAHTMVTKTGVFPYVVAILKKTSYLSAGALVDKSWIITAADALFFLRDSARVIRVRLGSFNNKKGGTLLPIKYFEIHPYFSDARPEYDIALVKLPHPVKVTPTLSPIRLQKRVREVTATHFIVTSWPMPVDKTSQELQQVQSMELVKRRRILQVSHLHPTDLERCAEEKEGFDVPAKATDTIMCLDPGLGTEPCNREAGAPVVLNGILWGIVSSWKSEDCEVDPGPSFVTLVSAPSISSWLHATLRGHRWNSRQEYRVVLENEDDSDDYYEDLEVD